MKKLNLILLASAFSLAAVLLSRPHAAEPTTQPTTFQIAEFATIRWAGRDNSYLIRPNGRVDKLRLLFEQVPRPEGIDERAYYLNVAMNGAAKEGYELAGVTTPDQIVMKRAVSAVSR
jgi:hypothetical protein